MNGVMNGIVSGDGEYQAILRKSDIYSGELDRMDLSKEIRLLIDRYVSEQNALGLLPDSPILPKNRGSLPCLCPAVAYWGYAVREAGCFQS